MNKKLVKKHAVMMEYVIVAVLIAAAVVVAVMVFGRTTKEEFNVAATAMSDAKGAEDLQKNLKDTTQHRQGRCPHPENAELQRPPGQQAATAVIGAFSLSHKPCFCLSRQCSRWSGPFAA